MLTKKRARMLVRSARLLRGLTLIELLVVIVINAVLISVLLPALSKAREESRSAKCTSNLRSIIACSHLYLEDQGGAAVLPWFQYPSHPGYDPNLYTPWVFGGFQSTILGGGSYTPDSDLYPAEVRPLNRFAAPGALGKAVIDLYICPSDRSHTAAPIGSSPTSVEEEPVSSWQANGSSYACNTRFAQGYSLPSGNFYASAFASGPESYSSRLAPRLVGGRAARFIFWVEHGFYSATYRAGPTINGIGGGPAPQRFGWHKKWSHWNVGFFDGHVLSGYFDTRQIYGLGGTIWEPE